MSASSYAAIKSQHASLPAFSPPIPTSLLPYIALFAFLGFFALSFGFSTLPRTKSPATEIGMAALASGLAGAGVVALFCTAGVYV